MHTLSSKKYAYIKTTALGFTALLLAISIVMYPDAAFQASLKGLKIWWEVVFPALLPFFITAEILLGFGIVHFMGVLLEPLMKPFFNVPGVGAFVLAMGFASGYPMGAKLTSRLREQNMISKTEGERLVSFTSTSDPLFLFGAIAVGFFHNAALGVLLAAIHYLSSIFVGLSMRFYKINSFDQSHTYRFHQDKNIFIRAIKEMYQARVRDGRKFGKLMGDAVMSSIETLVMIGGFIMMFSVILAILIKINIIVIITKLISFILVPIGLSEQFSGSMINGFFEVTIGAKAVSEVATSIPFIQKVAVVSVISAWSGISVHAQVAAILQKTDIRYTPFLFARMLHTVFAFFLAIITVRIIDFDYMADSLPAFMYQVTNNVSLFPVWRSVTYLGVGFISIILILSFTSLFIYFLKRK